MRFMTGGEDQDFKTILASKNARAKAAALVAIEALIDDGMHARDAVRQIAHDTGFSERSLWMYRAKTNFVPRSDWEKALVRKKAKARPMVSYHPLAMARFFELCRQGGSIAACYCQMAVEAEDEGWEPIPSERTARRLLDAKSPPDQRYKARRDARQHDGG